MDSNPAHHTPDSLVHNSDSDILDSILKLSEEDEAYGEALLPFPSAAELDLSSATRAAETADDVQTTWHELLEDAKLLAVLWGGVLLDIGNYALRGLVKRVRP